MHRCFFCLAIFAIACTDTPASPEDAGRAMVPDAHLNDAGIGPDATSPGSDAATEDAGPTDAGPSCGDGVCSDAEDCNLCSADCGECSAQDTAHTDIAPDGFAGSVDFVHAIIDADTTGTTHRIVVERYHGSAGAVSVSYRSAGAPHTEVSGSLSWADGELGRKSFTLRIPEHSLAGEERVHVDLHSPEGGVRLGREEHSRMYIVTDDGSFAEDAIWANAETGAEGNAGTREAPVNTVVRAIALAEEAGSNHVYLEGTFPITEEETISNFGNSMAGIYLPSRDSEGERLIIRAAPGRTATIDGVDNGGLDRMGLFANDRPAHAGNFITVSHLNFRNLAGGVVYRYAEGQHPTVEHCNMQDIDGARGTNVAGVAPWGVASFIVHNTRVTTVRVDGERNGNGACMQSYGGANVFVQQSTMIDCDQGFFHKLSPQEDDGTQHASLIFRRNVGWNIHGLVRFSIQGTPSPGHSYSLVSQNIFRIDNPGNGVALRASEQTALPLGRHNEITHNVIDRRQVRSDYVALYTQNHLHTSFYGNVVLDAMSSRFMQRHLFSADAAGFPAPAIPEDGTLFDHIDNNLYVTADAAPIVYTKGRDYNHTAGIDDARSWGIEGNSAVQSEVPFPELAVADAPFDAEQYRLAAGSSHESAAPGSLPLGAWLIGDELFGAQR